MRSLFVLLAALAVAYASVVGVAHLRGTTLDPVIDGTVYFVQLNDTYVWVWANVSGIQQNFNSEHGMHIHQYGDVFDQNAGTTLGAHYVGGGSPSHSCYPNTTRHEGDMGNWQVTNGAFLITKTLDLLRLTAGTSIIGKGIVFHNATDDCGASGLATGNAGSRLATGVVGIANPAYYPADVLAAVAMSTSSAVTPNDAISGDTNPTKASAALYPTAASATLNGVYALFEFEQDGTGQVTITGKIFGLPSGAGWGLHIHTYADWYTNGVVSGAAAGPHYDTTNSTHAGPFNATRHTGDLGNICTYDSGAAYYQWVMTDGRFTLNGANNILGRNIIIHGAYDNMTAAGASQLGPRIAQGVIGVQNATVMTSSRITLPATVNDPLCAAFAGATPAPTPAPTPAATSAPTSAPTGTPAPTTTPTGTPAPTTTPTGTPAPTTTPGTPGPTTPATRAPTARPPTSAPVGTTSSASSLFLSAFVFVAAIVALF